ncbi:hypothetical protein Mgra_00007223 [Meloidogyne graminicola]|uniref:glucuronosyltransferase n=1 Tax=Meloidogyne graminicola TaxID=189291 RepID=A0A8S9ZJ96_9BILA|nr:hypothetical protein Mgra_00007223 [Meloidogyne graminicola]
MPSNFIKLFKKIKYYFVNQNIHGIFKPFPLHKKIVYIGGIHIEENNKINIFKKEFNEHEYHCVVLVSFGTVKMFGDLNIEDIKIMFYNFSFYNCLFKVRINKEYIKEIYINNNIQIIEEFIDQQKILFETNTKLFISHCGQHIIFINKIEKILKTFNNGKGSRKRLFLEKISKIVIFIQKALAVSTNFVCIFIVRKINNIVPIMRVNKSKEISGFINLFFVKLILSDKQQKKYFSLLKQ